MIRVQFPAVSRRAPSAKSGLAESRLGRGKFLADYLDRFWHYTKSDRSTFIGMQRQRQRAVVEIYKFRSDNGDERCGAFIDHMQSFGG